MSVTTTQKVEVTPGYWWVREKGSGDEPQIILVEHVGTASSLRCWFFNFDSSIGIDSVAGRYDFLGRVPGYNAGDYA